MNSRDIFVQTILDFSIDTIHRPDETALARLDTQTLRATTNATEKQAVPEVAAETRRRVYLHSSTLGVSDEKVRNYQAYFKPLIFEECRAVIAQSLKKVYARKLHATTMTRQDVSFGGISTSEYTNLAFTGPLPLREIEGARTHIAVLLQSPNRREPALLGIAWVDDIKGKKVTINVDVKQSNILGSSSYGEGSEWDITLLGALVTQSRMYQACCETLPALFMRDLSQGKIAPLPSNAQRESARTAVAIQPFFQNLNESQQDAVTNFMALERGVQLLQGPPGTGKTTTITAIAQSLVAKGKRVLICAPSNKAVHVIAARLLEQGLAGPIALAGVDKNIPPALRPIFIHTWGREQSNFCDEMALGLQSCRLSGTTYQTAGREADFATHASTLASIETALKQHQATIQSAVSDYTVQRTQVQLISQITQAARLLTTLQEPGIAQLIIQHFETQAIDKNTRDFPELSRKSQRKKAPQQTQASETTPEPRQLTAYNRAIDSLISSIAGLSQTFRHGDYEASLLNKAHIVLCTLSVSGRSKMLAMQRVECLIVDEAGQAVEAETLIPMQHAPNKCLLVGDVNQLPATVISQVAKDHLYDWSMLWRLQEEHQQAYTMLTTQYRMIPEIRQWPSERFYGGFLCDGDNIESRTAPAFAQDSMLGGYKLIDIPGREQRVYTSFKNTAEIESISRTLDYIVSNGQVTSETSIGIISFYMGQVTELKKALEPYANRMRLTISTVDGFQGEECDIIMISTVRANPRGNVGFTDDFRRLNVAITRAKFSLLIFSHTSTFAQSDTDMAALIADAKLRDGVFCQQGDFMSQRPDARPPCSYERVAKTFSQAVSQMPPQRTPARPPAAAVPQHTSAEHFPALPTRARPKKPAAARTTAAITAGPAAHEQPSAGSAKKTKGAKRRQRQNKKVTLFSTDHRAGTGFN